MKFAGAAWAALRGKRSTARANHMEGNIMATQLFQPPHGSPAWFHAAVARAAESKGIISEVVSLGPDLAAELLRNNPDNRALRPMKLRQITRDIQEDRWTFNGEPIIISREGHVNDGQHRANAVIEANKAVPVLMVFGLDRQSRTTVDQGAARGAADYMTMDGIKNAAVHAAIGRMLLAYERGDGKILSKMAEISNAEIIAAYAEDDAVAHASTFATTMHRYSRRYAAPAVIGFCLVVLSRINAAEADTYMRQVCVGENIRKTDPAFAVREGLQRDRTTPAEKVHMIFRGWNAFRQKRKLELAKVVGNLPALI